MDRLHARSVVPATAEDFAVKAAVLQREVATEATCPESVGKLTEGGFLMPPLTALQFIVLGTIEGSGDWTPGIELRSILKNRGLESSGPKFYQMMARLEDRGYVEVTHAQRVILDQYVSEARYRTTEAGRGALKQTHDFFDLFWKVPNGHTNHGGASHPEEKRHRRQEPVRGKRKKLVASA
jgi:DNA-binding PadR family transcriptional regulator